MEMYSLRGNIPLSTYAVPAMDIVDAALMRMVERMNTPNLQPVVRQFPMLFRKRSSTL